MNKDVANLLNDIITDEARSASGVEPGALSNRKSLELWLARVLFDAQAFGEHQAFITRQFGDSVREPGRAIAALSHGITSRLIEMGLSAPSDTELRMVLLSIPALKVFERAAATAVGDGGPLWCDLLDSVAPEILSASGVSRDAIQRVWEAVADAIEAEGDVREIAVPASRSLGAGSRSRCWTGIPLPWSEWSSGSGEFLLEPTTVATLDVAVLENEILSINARGLPGGPGTQLSVRWDSLPLVTSAGGLTVLIPLQAGKAPTEGDQVSLAYSQTISGRAWELSIVVALPSPDS